MAAVANTRTATKAAIKRGSAAARADMDTLTDGSGNGVSGPPSVKITPGNQRKGESGTSISN